MLDAELFFKCEASSLEGFLELKPEGKKMKVMKKLNELKTKFEKEGHIEYLDMGLLEDLPEDVPALKFQKSTTMKVRSSSPTTSISGGPPASTKR
jgi:hypothetical protein